MEILKKLAVFMLATMAAVLLIAWSLHSFGFRSPIFAFVVNWFTLAWIATVTLVARISLPAGYYTSKPFERTGQVYERMGIRLVKRFLRRGPLRVLSPTLRLPTERTLPALRNLENEMRKAETAHAITFLCMLLVVGYALVQGRLDAGLWMLLFSIVINIYPILLQRYNRIKLQELIRRQDGREVVGPGGGGTVV
ncbi:MAG TPA: hypothetical protein VF784_00080 [Anaerolineales bacterium]